MNRTDIILSVSMIFTIVTALVLYFALSQLGIDVNQISENGTYTDNVLYVLEVILDLMTIVFCYLAPKLMTFDFVKKSIRENEDNYLTWAVLRWSMLNLVVILPIIFHFIFGCASVIWCSLVGVIMMIFIWPSRGRGESEIARCKE